MVTRISRNSRQQAELRAEKPNKIAWGNRKKRGALLILIEIEHVQHVTFAVDQ